MSESEKKSFQSIFTELSQEQEELNGHDEYGFDEETSFTDEIDHEILIQRDAHFGGDFDVMLEYYEKDGIGVHEEIECERIAYLQKIEMGLGQNLAATMLSISEAERVARARRAYETLKEIYTVEDAKSPFPKILADLILTEHDEPQEEIDAVVAQGTRIVPELLQIIKSDEMYDSASPGYGGAPFLAAFCLGKIKDPSAIIPLFELLGKDIGTGEEMIVAALHEIGEPAKQFLLDVVKSRPITEDNVNAAFALSMFAEDQEVAIASCEQLRDSKVRKTSLLRIYLLFNSELLRGTSYAQEIIALAKDPDLDASFRKEVENLIQDWDIH